MQQTNPNSNSYLNKSVKKVYETLESKKRCKYNERILHVERGTFTPLIFSITGGYGPECKTFLKLLCNKICNKKNESFNDVISFLRVRLSFTILKLSLLCIRGSRNSWTIKDCNIEDFNYALNNIKL